MEPLYTEERLLGSLRDVPSREWAMLFMALMLAWVLVELFVGRLGLHLLSVESDRGSALAVVLSAFLGLGLAVLLGGLGWLPLGNGARWLGLGVMAMGLALRVFSILWLGTMFTRFVQILPGHRLVTSGPYRFVRHPSYSGLLLFFAGLGPALGSWLSLAAMTAAPLLGILYRIRVEERALLEAFGEEYAVYKRRVPALVPFAAGRKAVRED